MGRTTGSHETPSRDRSLLVTALTGWVVYVVVGSIVAFIVAMVAATNLLGDARDNDMVQPANLSTPAVTGLDQQAAAAALEAAGYKHIEVTRVRSPEPAGTVIEQWPPAGSEWSTSGPLVEPTAEITVSRR